MMPGPERERKDRAIYRERDTEREQVCIHWVVHRGISGDLQDESHLEGHERVP